MFKVTYQVKTWLQMERMGWKQWQESLELAAPIVAEVRRLRKLYKETGDERYKDKADELKRSLPGACFQASDYEESVGKKKYNKGKRGRWREQIHAYLSGLAVIDVDHCGNPRELFERITSMHDLKKLGILLVYVSASGEGLKIVFKARPEWGNLICNQYEMASLLGILQYVDDACKDSSRLSFLTGEDDVLYIDKTELFDEEETLFSESEEVSRTEYDLQFGERYRQGTKGESSPIVKRWIDYEAQQSKKRTAKKAVSTLPAPPLGEGHNAAQVPQSSKNEALPQRGNRLLGAERLGSASDGGQGGEGAFSERELSIIKALNAFYGKELGEGQKHPTFCQQTAHWLLWLVDNNPEKAIAMAYQLDYVKNWKPREGEVEELIESAAKKKLLKSTPKALKELLEKAGIDIELPTGVQQATDPMEDLPFEHWCDEIENLFDVFPCLREVCEPHPRHLWPFLLFASAAMMGTCMTLTYYRFYADPSIRSRLNYIILGVGDPTSGKGTLSRLQEVLLAPIIDSDRLADEATNEWKEKTDASGANKDKEVRQHIYNRMFGPRASNTEFIRSMMNYKTFVDGEDMNNHLITVDSEKDNSINMSKSGGWQNRDIMVLKSFHNEFDSQHYSNKQSVSGRFRVHWNQIETCTPPTLKRLVNERNFNSGLDTRMATIPMGKPDFDMIPLESEPGKLIAANETLREWSYKLDQRQGELPVWPLVEHVHRWCDERRAIAEFNDKDQADWLLIKRVPYYGLNVSIPYIDMRHWQEREQTGTYVIDDTDRRLCNLVLDIQYRTQLHWFYGLHRKYYDDQLYNASVQKRRTNKYLECFRKLPEEFTTEKFAEVFGYANNRSGQKTLERLLADKAIERAMRGNYRKLVSEL